MGTQQFCLKWNNHNSNMLAVFQQLLSNEDLVDVTLACEGLSLKAHKLVLSACSPFFQSVFVENPCKHPIVIMKDMRYTDLKAIIDFMYHGEVNVSQDQLSALLKTAETLRVKGLAEVTGENAGKAAQETVTTNNSSGQSQSRSESPLNRRKRGRPRRRSLSDSNRSDSEDQIPSKALKGPDSPEIIEETSKDNSEPSNDTRQRLSAQPVTNSPASKKGSHVPTEEPASGDEVDDFEPSKLMEQTMTTDNVPVFSESRSIPLPSHLSVPTSHADARHNDTSNDGALVPIPLPETSIGSPLDDSSQDIKPSGLVPFEDPPISPVAGPSHQDSSSMMYLDNSSLSALPGPSNYQTDKQSTPQPATQDLTLQCSACRCNFNTIKELNRHSTYCPFIEEKKSSKSQKDKSLKEKESKKSHKKSKKKHKHRDSSGSADEYNYEKSRSYKEDYKEYSRSKERSHKKDRRSRSSERYSKSSKDKQSWGKDKKEKVRKREYSSGSDWEDKKEAKIPWQEDKFFKTIANVKKDAKIDDDSSVSQMDAPEIPLEIGKSYASSKTEPQSDGSGWVEIKPAQPAQVLTVGLKETRKQLVATPPTRKGWEDEVDVSLKMMQDSILKKFQQRKKAKEFSTTTANEKEQTVETPEMSISWSGQVPSSQLQTDTSQTWEEQQFAVDEPPPPGESSGFVAAVSVVKPPSFEAETSEVKESKIDEAGPEEMCLDDSENDEPDKSNKTQLRQCSYCDYATDSTKDFFKHVIAHSVAKEHTCNACGANFSRFFDFQNHTCAGQRPFDCSYCGVSFKTKASLMAHMKMHSMSERQSIWTCSFCGKIFDSKSSFKKHQKKH